MAETDTPRVADPAGQRSGLSSAPRSDQANALMRSDIETKQLVGPDGEPQLWLAWRWGCAPVHAETEAAAIAKLLTIEADFAQMEARRSPGAGFWIAIACAAGAWTAIIGAWLWRVLA
jgi:hypothetical protein